jgi:RNA polymerase sigma factor (sigma-70 family)
MNSDPSVVALVTRAAGYDQEAWNEIVERYVPLVWAICARYRLSRPDIEDVSQSVWLLLVEQLGKLREPAALPGWLATTTRHECLRVLRVSAKYDLSDRDLDEIDDAAIEEEIITAERNAALRAALSELPERCQQLLLLLVSDPPVSYAEIGSTLQLRVGSIGPQRARCLEQLRRSHHLVTFIEGAGNPAPARITGGEPHA